MDEVMSVQRVRIGREYDEVLADILCYPYPSHVEYKRRVEELMKLGIEELELVGSAHIGEVDVLGKGWAGIVVKALWRGRPCVLKIRRVDSERESLEQEARYNIMANCVGIGPVVYAFSRNFIVREYIEGEKISQWISKARGGSIKHVMKNIIYQCFKLDMLGLDHGELVRPAGHVLISRDERPYIIDFESASISRRVRNVTSFVQYFFVRRNEASKVVEDRIGGWDRDRLIEALRLYKRKPSKRALMRILEVLGL
ncbi:MAG: serine/threonine protein kinase [Thermoprotei archaeon]|nr:MAG: serine/threonine protein kinase [Thermoprotei archaeon]RLF24845.1 MAG: serine/threonine protein kinase [Thermoprotei archaeon]